MCSGEGRSQEEMVNEHDGRSFYKGRIFFGALVFISEDLWESSIIVGMSQHMSVACIVLRSSLALRVL